MQNYEWLILDQLGSDLTPKAKYERLRYLLEIERLYKATKEKLEFDLDWFGKGNVRYKDAQNTYDVLTGISEPEEQRHSSTFDQLAAITKPDTKELFNCLNPKP